MGVFLSKPSVEKFSEDGEDDIVGFGVSSMQGWRRNMEDAHVAVLDVKHEGAVGTVEREGDGVSKDTSVRVFGVFDGHGGKEVALFVQEHLVEELVKLDEYKGGDFPAALGRSFHRMDEMLEGAANELRRVRGMTPEAGGDRQEDTEGEEKGKAEATEVGTGEEGEGGGGGEGGRDGVESSIEERRAILQELSAFRSRKNPSDFEEPPSPEVDDGPPLVVGSSGGVEDDSEEEEAGGALERMVADADTGDGSGGGGGGDDVNMIDVGVDTGPAEAEAGGSKGDNKIKMADALELFHRILDVRKDGREGGGGGVGEEGGAGATEVSDEGGEGEGGGRGGGVTRARRK